MADGIKDENGLASVKHIVLILSGKGGVGKSTVATQLACCLYKKGMRVGLLDIDLCGPSIPRMVNLEGSDVHQCSNGWVPVYTKPDQRFGVMSIGFLLSNKDDPVVWRGPKKNSMIKQFITDVCWGELDYLIIDTPPGTSDEHITVVDSLKSFNPDGAILVTTPQAVAVNDVRRELTFCRKTGVPILGIIENMSGFVCPYCSECSNIFSSDGGRLLAEHYKVPFLGRIPLDPNLTKCVEKGQDFLDSFIDSKASEAFTNISNNLHLSENNT